MSTRPEDHEPEATGHAWPEVMLASEVAEYLRVSYATVIKMTKAGDIPALAIGREFRYLRAEIDKLLGQPARTGHASHTRPHRSEETDDEAGDSPGARPPTNHHRMRPNS
jgi:excisionase family DNA binding protein